MTRILVTGVLLAALLGSAAEADLTGSSVVLLLPDHPVDEGLELFRCVVGVENDSQDAERILVIHLTFDWGIVMTPSMDYVEIAPGRPDFVTSVDDYTASWQEQDEVNGGIHLGEHTQLGIYLWTDFGIPDGAELPIYWQLVGSSGSEVDGWLSLLTPVQSRTWSTVKALYLAD